MEDQTKHLQRCLLSIATDVCAVCDRHNIRYSMDGGTFLGAVRHKGFIPWDDDMDIGMKREEYERFLAICRTELDQEKYFIQTCESEEKYALGFLKIQLRGTEIIEDFSKNVDIRHGVFLDIFPYDNLPDSRLRRKVFLLKNLLMKNIIWVKCGYGTQAHKKSLRYVVYKFLGVFFSLESLKRYRENYIKKYNKLDTEFCFTADYPKIHLKNAWFDTFAEYPFETIWLKGFREYDSFLTNMYGDYMELPPKEERVVHSNYTINFGKY